MDRVFSFLLWPKREVRGPWKHGRKKQGSITCRTDWANEANKMFIIWFCWLFRFWKGNRELEVRTATYGPGIDQSQHAKSVSHIIILFTFHNGFTYKRFDVQEWKDFSENSGWENGWFISIDADTKSLGSDMYLGEGDRNPNDEIPVPSPTATTATREALPVNFGLVILQLIGPQSIGSGLL